MNPESNEQGEEADSVDNNLSSKESDGITKKVENEQSLSDERLNIDETTFSNQHQQSETAKPTPRYSYLLKFGIQK